MRLYLIAFQFLTIIPLPFTVRCEERDLGRSMAFFPVVGLTLGLLLVGINHLLDLILPRAVTDILLIALLAGITGALHLDGVADVFDGLAARGSRERFLDIMKDPRCGPVGAAALLLLLIIKYQALIAVPEVGKDAALFLFPLMGRFSQVICTVGATRARIDGLGSTFIGGAGWRQLLLAAVTSLAAALYFAGLSGIGLFGMVCLVTCWLRWWAHQRLGGITGDVIGFVSEMNEAVTLLVLVAIGNAL
jgi:adenosylcobinamide-GDP ribazoletransferase